MNERGAIEVEMPETLVPGPLKSDGGNGTSGGMEARIARLEADVAHIASDVGTLKTDMRDARERLIKLETKVDHLPRKGFVVTVVMSSLAFLTALSIFQGQIQHWIGLVQR